MTSFVAGVVVGGFVGVVVGFTFAALVATARAADRAATLAAHARHVTLPPGWEDHPAGRHLRALPDNPDGNHR